VSQDGEIILVCQADWTWILARLRIILQSQGELQDSHPSLGSYIMELNPNPKPPRPKRIGCRTLPRRKDIAFRSLFALYLAKGSSSAMSVDFQCVPWHLGREDTLLTKWTHKSEIWISSDLQIGLFLRLEHPSGLNRLHSSQPCWTCVMAPRLCPLHSRLLSVFVVTTDSSNH